MKCSHESHAPGFAPVWGMRREPCFCGDGVGVLGEEGFAATTVLESIIETSMRLGLLEELEAMGLTLSWDEEARRWQTTGTDEQPWMTGVCELEREPRH